jgi:hypothetical protein
VIPTEFPKYVRLSTTPDDETPPPGSSVFVLVGHGRAEYYRGEGGRYEYPDTSDFTATYEIARGAWGFKARYVDKLRVCSAPRQCQQQILSLVCIPADDITPEIFAELQKGPGDYE